MPDELVEVTVAIMTPQGPIIVKMSPKDFLQFINRVDTFLGNVNKQTPIPKVFEDAFSKEE